MKVQFASELYVATYNVSIDDGPDTSFTPNGDGSGLLDLTPFNLTPGDHTVKADAVNPSGVSGYCAEVSFTVPEPIAAIPVITVIPDVASKKFR